MVTPHLPMVTPHLPWIFHAHPSSRFLVILLTKNKQRNKKRNKQAVVLKHNKPHPHVAHRIIAWFLELAKNVIRSSHMVTPHLPWKFHTNRCSRYLVILLTKKQTKKSIENNTPSPIGGWEYMGFLDFNDTLPILYHRLELTNTDLLFILPWLNISNINKHNTVCSVLVYRRARVTCDV